MLNSAVSETASMMSGKSGADNMSVDSGPESQLDWDEFKDNNEGKDDN